MASIHGVECKKLHFRFAFGIVDVTGSIDTV
jgi:hypothetical protein